ncbi:MAG: TetR/AcrR family transcriptional regulator [Alphaproteobacteria bacterium]|nr:TetR/AcrR family transcriptional regulator [Alphaproteobacteria bacterium]
MNTVKIKAARKPRVRRPYHHGDLPERLVEVAEAVIRERGVDGFSLREVVRRAGVSPAAPAHHFGDARGLLSEVALRGFRAFGDALAAADARGGTDPEKRLYEQGLAYVTFTLKHPARFQLMFRHGKYDIGYKDLPAASERAYQVLEDAVRAAMGLAAGEPMTDDANGFLMATWSVVHGFAHLALGEELTRPARARGGKDQVLQALLPLTLKHLPRPKRPR